MANINGINVPPVNDPAYATKVSGSLEAIDNHDHSGGKGLPVARVGANAVSTASIQDDAVTTAKIADGAVTEDKLSADVAARLPQIKLIGFQQTITLYGQVAAPVSAPVTPTEVLSDEVVPASQPVTFNDIQAGDIVELSLVPSSPIASSPTMPIGSLSTFNSGEDQVKGVWGVFDQDNNFISVTTIGYGAAAGGSYDLGADVPCGSFKVNFNFPTDQDSVSFRLGHVSDPFVFSTVETKFVALVAKLYRRAA